MGDLYKMFKSGKLLKQGSGGGGGGGTSDYENLENLPSMNGHVVKGAMVSSDLDLPSIEDVESKADASEMEQALQGKADKSTTYTKTEVDTALGDKVDKVSGKGLSTNDFTTAEKTKLAGIAEGAEVNEIQGVKVNNTTINPDANKVVNITVPTSATDVSALPDTTKYAAALSLTINSSTFVMTGQLIDQDGDNLGTAQTIDLPLESVVVGGSYNSQTKKVVLTLQNGNTIEFSVADLVSGLQTELSASNKLNPAYINYDSTHAAVTEAQREQIATNQNNISINSIKSSITMEQGYTLVTQSTLYQQGKHIFGNLIIKKDSGNFSDTSETVCTLGKPPAITGMLFCGFGVSEWGIESIGYAFLGSNGGVSVKDTKTTNTTVNIAVDYVIS